MQNILYIMIFGLFSLSLFGVIIIENKIKKLIFLGIIQTSVIMLFVASAYKCCDFNTPIYIIKVTKYVNPVPHVLMLTAIVVGIAVSAVGLAMIIKINQLDSK